VVQLIAEWKEIGGMKGGHSRQKLELPIFKIYIAIGAGIDELMFLHKSKVQKVT